MLLVLQYLRKTQFCKNDTTPNLPVIIYKTRDSLSNTVKTIAQKLEQNSATFWKLFWVKLQVRQIIYYAVYRYQPRTILFALK